MLFSLLVQLSAVAAQKTDAESYMWNATDRKAGYYFLEAVRMRQLVKPDAYFDLLNRAHQLAPDNTIISFYYGYCSLLLANTDPKVDASFALMKKHIDSHPDDFREARLYAVLNSRLSRFAEASRTLENIVERNPASIDDKYTLARTYALGKEFAKAVEIYDSIEANEGISQQVSMQKIEMYLSMSDTLKTINEARHLYESAPRSIVYNDIMGSVFQHLGMADSAFVYFDKMEKLDPTNPEAQLAKSSYYYSIGDSINQDKFMYRALTNENLGVEQKVEELTNYIRQLYHDNDSSARIDNLFSVMLEQHPHEAAIRRLYGSYLANENRYEEAVEQFSYALDIEPTNADDWKNVMVISMIIKDYKRALAAAEKALEFNPDQLNLCLYIASTLVQLKEYQRAVEVCRDALEKAKKDKRLSSDILGTLGDTYQAMGDTVASDSIYEQALALEPGNINVLNNYAYSLSVRSKDLDKAERMSAITIKEQPENGTYLDTYAWVFFKKREYNLALMYIEKAINCYDDPSPELFEHYGDILFMNQQPEKALEQWQKALELNPDSDLLKRKVENKTYFYE